MLSRLKGIHILDYLILQDFHERQFHSIIVTVDNTTWLCEYDFVTRPA